MQNLSTDRRILLTGLLIALGIIVLGIGLSLLIINLKYNI